MCLIKRNALKNIRLIFLPFYGKKLLKLVFQCKVVVVFSLLLLILQFTPLIQRFCSEEPEKQ